MIIVRDSSPMPENLQGAVLAIGNFDGLHLGHQAVIAQMLARAKATGKPAALMTFEPHPRRLFRPDLPVLKLQPFAQKARLLKEWGLDMLRVVQFTRAFADTTAEQFVSEILQKQLKVSHVVTGDDFIFGHNREGSSAYLQARALKDGFGYTPCAQFTVGEDRCSTTRIRELLARGHVAGASELLGYTYNISGHVSRGDKRGRGIGFPTANMYPAGFFTPANGVYAVRAKVGERDINGVANLGIRPTFGSDKLRLEVHLFDFDADIYDAKMHVKFIQRIRDEKKFDGIDALKNQIAEDVIRAKMILST